MNLKEVYKNLGSSEKGLTEQEADKRLKKYGKNNIREFKQKSRLKLLLAQFNSFLIYILILAALISFFIGHLLDGIVILIIVLLNGGIGFFQEYKAESIIEKLKESLDYDVFVKRDEKQTEVSSQLLVPGDVLILNSGEKILADCRVIESENLGIDESVLTGESFPVDKENGVLKTAVVLAERTNMLYAGTSVVKGKCVAMVVSTGHETEFGKLAELVQKTEDEISPLEQKMNSFSKKISVAVLIFVAIAFFIGVSSGIDKVEMFLVSVSLAVGAIPEGLPAIIAITLAVAIKRMYKSNTLIRKLSAAETLGRATVICTDKTGTLTEEELSVDKIYASKVYSLKDKLNKNLRKVLEIGILCNNARDEKDKILGDPTETALISAAKKFGFDKKIETEKNPRLKEFIFSSERKMMSIVRENGEIKTSYVKGAPGIVLRKCTKEFVDGKIRLLSEKRKKELGKIHKSFASDGLRVLGFAFRQLPSKMKGEVSEKDAEEHLTFAGFMGMIDPPRKEIKNAIKEAIEAGIDIKIITGDSALTTKAVAGKIGLKGEVIEGKELDQIDEHEWDELVKTKTIFARVTPEQKLKIVETIKNQKEIVAVTGDGVNDILALKKADIGISMGLRGSDVARDSSDMVLLDDNFASIISATREGRRIFDNLKKSIKFLFAANVGEIFLVLFALILAMPLPLIPLAILWVNLVTDSLPALALAVEPAEKEVMKQKPRKDGLLGGIWQWTLIGGLLGFLSSFLVFNFALGIYELNVARTMAVTALIFFELFFAFTCKSDKSLFKTGLLNNKYLIYAFVVSAGIHLIAIYSLLGGAFGFVALSMKQLSLSVGIGLSGLVVFEGWKLVKKN